MGRAWHPGRQGWLLFLLLALTLVRGLIYVAVIPPWQSPDEPFHLLSARSALLQGAPNAADQWEQLKAETAASLCEFRFWEQVVHVPAERCPQAIESHPPRGLAALAPIVPRAPTYYMLALPLRLVSGYPITLQLYWARLFSVLVNLAVVATAFGVGRLLFPDDAFGRPLLPMIIVFLPQHTAIMAAVNDGNPAELWSCLAIYFWVRGIVKGFSWRGLFLVTLFTALAAVSKPTTYFLVPPLLVLLIGYGWRRLQGWWRLAPLGAVGCLIAGLALASERFRHPLALFISLLNAEGEGLAEGSLEHLPTALFETFRGFWAVLGWTSLPVSDAWAISLLILAILSVSGLLRLGWCFWRNRPRNAAILAVGLTSLLFSACVIFSLAIMLIVFASSPDQYGLYESRYLFPAIIPIVGLLVIGWRQWLPAGWRREGLVAVTALFFVFDTAVWVAYALPFFYPIWR